MKLSELKFRVKQVRLKRLAAEIAAEAPPKPLPRRHDTRPINFAAFRTWVCPHCHEEREAGEPRMGRTGWCVECRQAEERRLEEWRQNLARRRAELLSAVDATKRTAQEIAKRLGKDDHLSRTRVKDALIALVEEGMVRRMKKRVGRCDYVYWRVK